MARETVEYDVAGIVKNSVRLNELLNPDGSVEFSQNQALQLVVELRTSDPVIPANGQIWLRTDL